MWKFATLCIVLVLLLSPVYFASSVLADDPDVPQGSGPEMRLTWIPYWDMQTAAQIEKNIQYGLEMNLNTMAFEAYAHGMAMYNSAIVPKMLHVAEDFDPLAYATRRCHEEGLLIHAWFVTYYSGLWSKLETPGYYPAGHVLLTHPDWITQGKDGGHGSQYDSVLLDPGIPEVKEYHRQIMQEICSSYGVDGVVLDYIRYGENSQGYNPMAVSRFEAHHGYTPTDDWDPVWQQWRRDQVTHLISQFRADVGNKWLGAAAWGNYEYGYIDQLQDSVDWMEKGLVDYIVVMGYTNNNATFTNNNQFYLDNCYGRNVLPGVGAHAWLDPAGMAGQMELARQLGARGISLYSLYEIDAKANTQDFVDAVKSVFPEPVSPPPEPPVNQPPILEPVGNKTVAKGELLSFTISGTDPDGDTLTYSASNLPDGATFDPQTRTFSWTPGYDQAGVYPDIHFEVTDGELTDSEDITISVSNVNQPPVLNPIGNKTAAEGEQLEFTISAIDPDGDSLTYSASNLPQGASFDPQNQTFSWTPVQSGSYPNVHFEVSDGSLADSEDITISVGNVNQPPVLNPIGDKSVVEGEPLEFTISATDPDDDPLTYSVSNLPEGASFIPEADTFFWIPSSGQAGTYPNVHFEVSDGELTDSEDIIITVNTASPPPGGGGGPPTISNVSLDEITKTTADIRWTTHEPSTSQVEYWASPSKLSPLNARMAITHKVHLTDLTGGTTYHFRVMSMDRAGNLAVSDEHSFTTLGVPAAFSVSALDITPVEVDIGEEVTISVLVTNSGDATGAFKVILQIDDVVVATKDVVDLAGGASQKVTFTTFKDAAGTVVVDVNGITGSFVVREAATTEINVGGESYPTTIEEEPEELMVTAPSATPAFSWVTLGQIIGVALILIGVTVSTVLLRRRRLLRRLGQR